ncbi:MAG: hypothetical protein RLZZ436_3217 [Planctomycetota bacterium]|jgi:hypothetical protein
MTSVISWHLPDPERYSATDNVWQPAGNLAGFFVMQIALGLPIG